MKLYNPEIGCYELPGWLVAKVSGRPRRRSWWFRLVAWLERG